MSHGIPRLKLWCPHCGILSLLVPARNRIVLIDPRDHVILFWRPGSGIIRNTSLLLKSYMAYAWCVKFLKVCRWGIPLFDNSITQANNMFTRSFWMNRILIICTILLFIQSETSSGDTLFAMSIAIGSLMNCISCSRVLLKSYCTGFSNTWKQEMSRINLTIYSHRFHDIQASSLSLSHSIRWKAYPGREKTSRAWSEHWQWIALRFLTAPRMTGELRRKEPLMKW